MELVMAFNDWLNDIVWGPYMLVLLVGTGIYLSLRSNFIQVSHFGYMWKNTIGKITQRFEGAEGDITPFQAMSTALAATIGTGNIAGVATAIATGGPGAVFWMWLSAFFGMMTKFGEVVLAVRYRERKTDGSWAGGPMYYIANGLGDKWKWLAALFAIFGTFASFGIGNLTQANSVADALATNFAIPHLISGIVLMLITGLVVVGGIKRIAQVAEKLVPFMAIFYVVGGLIIISSRLSAVPAAFALIFRLAFTPSAAVGGFAGATIKQAVTMGIARGVFSNEAGLGSAPIAHATAKTDHPVRQGLWGIFEVFADTIVVCSITALSIVVTGAWQSGKTGAALTSHAFNLGLPGPGGVVVAIGIVLFAFSTLISWAFYGEKCVEYLIGSMAAKVYRFLFLPFIVLGAVGALEPIWLLADTLNGLMAIPNLIGLLGLSGVIINLTKEYFRKGL
ncbi:MAG: sodium:alanine symporter family protein [Firmicutes bacterium]|nr:sodium:alanine symporter family protein [Bacillota bacterium]